MYQVQQAIQLLNATKHLCLEKDVQRLKCQHPQWLKIDVFRNIMKFKLPPSIPLTPQWHHTQLKEFLMTVENFGMPHFFLTLIFDETSNWSCNIEVGETIINLILKNSKQVHFDTIIY
jgi:hypothetical protein